MSAAACDECTSGLRTFEHCVARLEKHLGKAIAQKLAQNSRARKNVATIEDAANRIIDSTDEKGITYVLKLFDLIESNFVDLCSATRCNIPPSRMAEVPALSISEVYTRQYADLVRSFSDLKARWLDARHQTERARPSGAGACRPLPKFGAPKTTAPAENNDNLDDDEEDRQILATIQQAQSEEDENQISQEERLEHLREIQQQIKELGEMQLEIHYIIDGPQQEKLDQAEAKANQADKHVDKGRKETFEAAESSTWKHVLVGAGVGAAAGGLLVTPAGVLIITKCIHCVFTASLYWYGGGTAAGAVVGGGISKAVAESAIQGSKDAEFDRDHDRQNGKRKKE